MDLFLTLPQKTNDDILHTNMSHNQERKHFLNSGHNFFSKGKEGCSNQQWA